MNKKTIRIPIININIREMEASIPIEKIKSTKSYTIISDKNNPFYLTIQNKSSIIYILSYYQDNIITHNYDKKLKLEELKKNKYLSLCDNIDDIYNELINLLDKNKSEIFERNNEIDLNIPIENLKVKEIKISMNEILMNNNEKIEQILSFISNLKEEINNLKVDNNNLKKEINNLKVDNNNLKEDMAIITEKNNNIKEDIAIMNKKIKILDELKLNKKNEINSM